LLPPPKSSLTQRAWCRRASSRTVDERPAAVVPIVDVELVEFECACREPEDGDMLLVAVDMLDSECRLLGDVCGDSGSVENCTSKKLQVISMR
jgi:hypothetical protein